MEAMNDYDEAITATSLCLVAAIGAKQRDAVSEILDDLDNNGDLRASTWSLASLLAAEWEASGRVVGDACAALLDLLCPNLTQED